MKTIKTIIIIALLASIWACDVDYFSNPNSPEVSPTSSIFNDNVKEMMDDMRDQWFGGRFTMVTMQYFTQSEYGDEDRYVYRETQRQTWEDFYVNLENLRKVLMLNTNEETMVEASASGDNDGQIASTRVIMGWAFNLMVDTWGDIPYYSYGSPSDAFQALQLADVETEVLYPAYATQEQVYTDILAELKAVADIPTRDNEGNLIISGFNNGDAIYHGDVEAWQMFANALRLRIALKIRGVNPTLANQHITEASANTFSTNADNAVLPYESGATNAAPYYIAKHVDKRLDFAMGHSFIELLKGENLIDTLGNDISTNPFNGMLDPRLEIYAAMNDSSQYYGMPVVESSAEAATIGFKSRPGAAVYDDPEYAEVLMEYAEVCFILSEINGWSQSDYENGVRASMEKWGVAEADIDAYITALPAASEETVLTQKYIALYMDSHTAWQEYRRSGYPQTLVMPNDNFRIAVAGDKDYHFVFEPLLPVTDLPNRLEYPQYEQTLNGDNRAVAIENLSNGDNIDSKLWWDTRAE